MQPLVSQARAPGLRFMKLFVQMVLLLYSGLAKLLKLVPVLAT